MKKNKLDIIYEDKSIIVINKPSHMLTISTDNEKEKTLFHQVMMYEKKKDKRNKIFVVHRLDKDTSGLIVFAKTMDAKMKLQNNWDKNTNRGYVAVVHGKTKEKAILKDYLMETKTLLVYKTNDQNKGKLAITEYERIKENKYFTLLKIKIKTGRKNQIRVQLNEHSNQIVGDKKYGKEIADPLRRLCLHANYLSFTHPEKKDKMTFTLDIPKTFMNLVDEKKN